MKKLEEKSKNYNLINFVYIISPKLLSLFHKTKNIDMTEFIKKVSKKKKIILYPAHEFWMDIGTKTDLLKSKN